MLFMVGIADRLKVFGIGVRSATIFWGASSLSFDVASTHGCCRTTIAPKSENFMGGLCSSRSSSPTAPRGSFIIKAVSVKHEPNPSC